jgi:hypothetical protein
VNCIFADSWNGYCDLRFVSSLLLVDILWQQIGIEVEQRQSD